MPAGSALVPKMIVLRMIHVHQQQRLPTKLLSQAMVMVVSLLQRNQLKSQIVSFSLLIT